MKDLNTAQRDALRTSAQELLTSADTLLDTVERDARDLTSAEQVRFRSLVERANFLNRKANGEAPEPAETPSRIFRAIRTLALANGNRVVAEHMARDAHDAEVALVLRAAAAGADTATSAWAGVIVAPTLGEFIGLLRARSALFSLVAPRPVDGAVTFPRMATGSASGFVAEGAPIPVKNAALDSLTLTPYKAAAMTWATTELLRRGDSLAEDAVMDPLADDIALGTDTVFLSADAAVAGTSPAGLFHTDNAAAALSATAGGTAAACAADLAKLLAAGASFTAPRLLINPGAIAAAIALAGSSDYAIIQALASGRIGRRVEVVEAGNLTLDTVALVDADGLLVASSGFELDVSQSALIVSDTAPAADPLSVASGGVSTFQRDASAIACKLFLSWRTKRTGQAQHITSCSWA